MSAGARAFELAPGVLEKISDTVTPQPVLAVVRTPEATLEDVADAGLVIVCVDVRDPGNAGALIRSAGRVQVPEGSCAATALSTLTTRRPSGHPRGRCSMSP